MRGPSSFLVVCGTLLLLGFSSVVAVRNWMGERALTEARKEQKRGNINGARDLYGEALSRGRTEGAVALAKMALYRRDWNGVETHAAQAMAADPSDGYPHILLAHAAAVSGNPEGAEGAELVLGECRKAAVLEPLNGKYWKSCADLTLRLTAAEARYRAEAVAAYRQALRFSPGGESEVLRFPAQVYPDVSFLAETVMEADVAGMTAAAGLLLELGRWEESRAAWWRVAEESAVPGAFSLAAARALARRGRHEEGLKAYEMAVASLPDDDRAWFGMGRSAEKTGDMAKAEASYRRAVQLKEGNVRYRKALSRITGER
jgi:tetratricopeptide (TPR) repeat protein